MKVFVSWSGEPSRQAAELMKQWLPRVIQEVEVWVSSQDIDKGDKWSASLGTSLSEIEFGILMITRENFSAPWIMFEAGALSKTVKSRVIPILCDLELLDLGNSPLSQFQNAFVNEEDIWQVVVSINSLCQRSLDEGRLKATFQKWWGDFRTEFTNIKFEHPVAAVPGGPKDQAERFEKIEHGLESIMNVLQKMQRDSQRTVRLSDNLMLSQLAALEEKMKNGAVVSVNDVNRAAQLARLLRKNSNVTMPPSPDVVSWRPEDVQGSGGNSGTT